MQNDPKSSKIKDKDEIGPRDMNGLTEEDGKVSIEDNSSVEKRISKTKGRAKKKISSKETTELNPINNLDIKVKDITTNDKEIGIKSKGSLKKSKAIDKKNALENKNEEKIILKEENNKESELEGGDNINKSKSTKTNELNVQSKTKRTTNKSSKGKSAVTSTKASARKKSASKELMGEFQAEGEKIEKSKTEHSKINVKKRTESIDKSEITNLNTYLFHQGKNYESYNILGSHIKTEKRKKGVQFVTWAT